jgi:hypothetical protein
MESAQWIPRTTEEDQMSYHEQMSAPPSLRFIEVSIGTMFGAATIGLVEIGVFNANVRSAAMSALGAMVLGPIFLGVMRVFGWR